MSKNKNTYKFDNMEAFRKLKTNIEFSSRKTDQSC